MSLINQMLRDLDSRHRPPHRLVDRVLVDLAPADLLAHDPRWRRLGLLLLVLGAVAAIGGTRLSGLGAAWPHSWHFGETPRERVAGPQVLIPGVTVPVPATVLAPAAVSVAPVAAVADTTGRTESSAALPLALRHAAAPTSQAPVANPATALTPAIDGPLLAEPVAPAAGDSSAVETPGSFHRQPSADSGAGAAEVEFQQAAQLLAAGDTERGLQSLKSQVLAHPAAAKARLLYARTLLKASRTTEAEAVLRTGLNLAPKEAALARVLAHLLYDRGDTTTALRILLAAAPPPQRDAEYHEFVAALHQRLGDHLAAIKSFHEVLNATPANGAAWIGLAISLVAIQSRAEAVNAFIHARQSGSLSPPMDAYAAAEVARLQVQP